MYKKGELMNKSFTIDSFIPDADSYAKVTGKDNLVRDEESGAIVNCDTAGYQNYIRMRESKKSQKEDANFLNSKK